MDGEHAFSAALTLVMVNVAFPYNERDAVAMETALGVLRGMSEKGNEYIRARLALLMNLLTTIRPRVSTRQSATVIPLPRSSPLASLSNTESTSSAGVYITSPVAVQDSSSHPENHLQPWQDLSFNFDINDDPGLWEEISGNIDIDMDTGWIECALRTEASQVLPPHG